MIDFAGRTAFVTGGANGVGIGIVRNLLGEGVKVAEHATGAVVDDPDPDQRSFDVDEIGRRRVIRYVTERIPGLDPKPVTELTCLYTMTPDSHFFVERVGPRLVVGSACSGHGFKFAPAIGKRLAALALDAL